MTKLKTSTNNSWTRTQAIALIAISLLLGVCGGWLIRRSRAGQRLELPQTSSVKVSDVLPSQPISQNFSSTPEPPNPEQLKESADIQAAPLLEQLKASSASPALLTQLGNLYYDAKQYPTAIDYYERALKLRPADAAVRTDLGTAYWYQGDADAAIAEFHKALSYEPNRANALFNLGIVKWKGKKDAAGAIEEWQKLLATSPGFEARAKVEDLIAEARSSLGQKP